MGRLRDGKKGRLRDGKKVITVDSDTDELHPSREEFSRDGSVRGGTYSGRLRSRALTAKPYHRDYIALDDIESSDCSFDDFCERAEKQLPNWGGKKEEKQLPNWGGKKERKRQRTDCGESCDDQNVSHLSSRNLPASDRARLTSCPYWTTKSRLLCNGWRDGRKTACAELPTLKNEISFKKKRSRRSQYEENAAEVCTKVGTGSRLRSSCEGSKLVSTGNMLTHMERFTTEFVGHHEGPATPAKPPIRKRKGGVLADDSPEYHSVNALPNRRTWSDSGEGPVQQQLYQLSAGGREVAEHSLRGVTESYKQSTPLSPSLAEAFFQGSYKRGDPYLGVLDEIVSGECYRPSPLPTGSQVYSGRGPNPSHTVSSLGVNVGSNQRGHSQGGGYVVSDRDTVSIASQPSADDSFGTAQSEARLTSDEEYLPPASYSPFQSPTGNAGDPFTTYPSGSRLSLSFRNDGVTQRNVCPISALVTDYQAAPLTPNKGTPHLSHTSASVPVNPVPDYQHGLLSTTGASSLDGGGQAEILDAREGLEIQQPSDGNLLNEEKAGAEVLFDLNELPEQQPRTNSKTRKKHRPKVFQEGRRPARARKPKNVKTKAGESPKEVERPRARKKQARSDLHSAQRDSLDKTGGQSTPLAANCGPAATDPNCARCQDFQRTIDAGMVTPSAERRASIAEDVLQSRVEQGVSQIESPQTPVLRYVLVQANNSLIMRPEYDETNSLPSGDGSPLSISSSAAPSLSRKRITEPDRLTASDSPENYQRGARRELFKKARGRRSAAVGKLSSGLGENCRQCPNGVTVCPTSVSDAEVVGEQWHMSSDASKPQAPFPLESLEYPMDVALSDPGLPAAAGAVKLQVRRNPKKSQARVLPTEVGKNAGSIVTSTETVTHAIRGRMRAAARAKSGHSNLSNSTTYCSVPVPLLLQQIENRMAGLGLNESASGLEIVPHVIQHSALVPYDGSFLPLRTKPFKSKVKLDEDDKRMWQLVMVKGTNCEDDLDKDTRKRWDEERAIMKSRAEKFINRMHLVQGDRRFSVWKGSVVDSVVGAFLTQNVSDHLSSSAFMDLAARFPVPRKKKTAADISQETTFTEVRIEEAFKISQNVTAFPVSSDYTEGAQETSTSAFHVEQSFDISEKSSVTEGGSCLSCNQQDHDALSTKVIDCKCVSEQIIQSFNEIVGSTSQSRIATEWNDCSEQTITWSTDMQEQNSSCSSKTSQSRCNSCLHNATSQAVECLEARGTGQEKPSRVVEDSLSLHSGLREVVFASSGESQVNSNCPVALLDTGDREFDKMTRAASKTLIQNDPQLLVGSLVVDLSLSGDDIVQERGLPQNCINEGFLTLSNNPTNHETPGNGVTQEKNQHSTTVENFGTHSCRMTFSSDSFGPHRLSEAHVLPGPEDISASAACVLFSSDSFDTNKFSEKLSSSSEASENGGQLQLVLRDMNESSNLHGLKSFMRKKLQVVPNVFPKQGPSSLKVGMGYSSELLSSSSSNQEKETQGPKKRSFLGLTGIARARVEQANISSKVAFDWESVRLKYTEAEMHEDQNENAHAGCKSFGSSNVENGADWDAVRLAKVEDVAHAIKVRGMNYVLAGRIQAFLERVQKEHGSVDLEWLRTISVEEAKSFLLSIRGLGLKSVECIRLLTLHHLAFPVDTNVGRVCVRLGWVPLEPLREDTLFHNLEDYPYLDTVQKYLWPRLCSFDQRTLYELHYQLITFGKVFCTKISPNCNACPMRDDCKHFASALASSRLALPAAAHDDAHSTNSGPLALPALAAGFIQKAKTALPPAEEDAIPGEEGPTLSALNSFMSQGLLQKPCEPIIEEPRTPEHVVADVTEIDDIEEFQSRDEGYDTFVGVSSQPSGLDTDTRVEVEIVLPPAEVSTSDTSSKALVLLPRGIASLPVPKLKNVGRRRTVHYVYELPDNHPLLQEMDAREPDDPCVYLLAIWSPGESPEVPPVLDDLHTSGSCDGFNSSTEESVKGTVLVPCRTAMRGIFPLNGTYFQVNEVFADHASSLQPIDVPRTLLWNLRRRFVYFGTSASAIFTGLSTEEIQACFWRGYVCVRGFDSKTRCPRPLVARLHFSASKMLKKQKGEKNSDLNAKTQD